MGRSLAEARRWYNHSMYYLPGVEQFFKRRPYFAFFLFGTVAATFGWYCSVQVRELLGFGSAPQALSVEQLTPPGGELAPGRWVEIRGSLQFHCEALVQVRHGAELAEYFFGHVWETYIPASDPSQQRLILFVSEGQVECQEGTARPWRGVLRAANNSDLERVKNAGLRIPRNLAVPAMRMEAYGGPRETRKWILMSGLGAAIMTFGAGFYWRKHVAMEKTRQ